MSPDSLELIGFVRALGFVRMGSDSLEPTGFLRMTPDSLELIGFVRALGFVRMCSDSLEPIGFFRAHRIR